MKKPIFSFLALLAILPALTACGTYDYFRNVSEVRYDIFVAETEEFAVTLSCVSREHPYAADGVPCKRADIVEISLSCGDGGERDFRVFVLGETTYGGDAAYRSVRGDYFYSQGVERFPEGSVTLRVEWDGEAREIVATSVKNERTLSPEEALDRAVAAEKERVEALTRNGEFCGEFYVRLLRRDVNYYYVGIVDGEGKTVSLLLDAESGEVLARRAP